MNTDARGKYLGNFDNGNLILVIYQDGTYELTNYELSNRYDIGKLVLIEQYDPEKVISAVHYDSEQKNFYVKRFKVETQTIGKSFTFVSESKGSRLITATTSEHPQIEMEYLKGRPKKKYTERLNINDLVEVKGWKARGNRLSRFEITFVDLVKQTEPEFIISDDDVDDTESSIEGNQNEPDDGEEDNKKQLDLFN